MTTTTNGCALPPVFRDGDFQMWIRRFEICAEANGWDPQTRALRLPTLLDGEAFMVYSSLDGEKQSCYAELKRALGNALQPGAGEVPAYAAFERRKMEPGESVRQFAYSLRLLCERAFPDVSSRAREAILKRRFQSGIPEKYAKMLMAGKKLHTLDDAVERTLQLMAIDQQFPEHTVANISSDNGQPNLTEMERKLNDISARLDRLLSESPGQSEEAAALQRYPLNVGQGRGGRQLQCWNCGRYGHIARRCRARNEEPPSNEYGRSGRREARQNVWLNERGSAVTAPRPIRPRQRGQ